MLRPFNVGRGPTGTNPFMATRAALIVKDLQQDHLPEGATPVRGTEHLDAWIAKLIEVRRFARVFYIRDWCEPEAPSCARDTLGAMFTPRLQSILGHTVTVISKGFDSDGDTSASPYAGECLDTGERLEELLLQQPLDSIVITGLNVADFAAETGLFFDTPTTILTDLCRWRVRNTARPARRDASPAIRGHADMKRSTEWLKTTR